MTKTKFTPAPWSAEGFDGRNAVVFSSANSEICIIEVGHFDAETEEEQKANANLIAAAPELYVVLEKCANLLRIYENHHIEKGDFAKADINAEFAATAEKVLAKARGEL